MFIVVGQGIHLGLLTKQGIESQSHSILKRQKGSQQIATLEGTGTLMLILADTEEARAANEGL